MILRGKNFVAHRCAAEHRLRITAAGKCWDNWCTLQQAKFSFFHILSTPGKRREDNIKMDLTEIVSESTEVDGNATGLYPMVCFGVNIVFSDLTVGDFVSYLVSLYRLCMYFLRFRDHLITFIKVLYLS
jgi:hypothetical protein